MGYAGTLWGVHAKDTMLRSGRVEEKKKKVGVDTPNGIFISHYF